MLGFIMSGYFFGFFVGTHLALPLINRIGHIRTFAFCAAFTACFSLLHVLFVDPYIWLLLRIMTGASLVILYTVIESWLNGQTSAENRGRVFAIYMMVTLIALALAQQFLHLASPSTFTLFAVSAILICVSVTAITWTRMAQPVFSDAPKMKLKRLWGLAPVALMAAVFSGLSMGAFWGMGALYAGRVGLDNSGIATFISCVIIGGAIFQYPLGRYSDHHDRRRVLAFASALAASAALLMSFFSNITGLFLVASVLYGGMAFFIYPVAVAHLVDHLDHDDILPRWQHPVVDSRDWCSIWSGVGRSADGFPRSPCAAGIFCADADAVGAIYSHQTSRGASGGAGKCRTVCCHGSHNALGIGDDARRAD